MTEAAKGPNPVLRARNAATAALVAAHEDEFHDLMDKACAEQGIEYARPLTAEQKAENDIKMLLDKYPHLADKFGESAVATAIRAEAAATA